VFEPENDIERALMRAAKEPDARPDFVRSLMDTEVFVAFIAEGGGEIALRGGETTARPGDQVEIPKGTRLQLATASRGDDTLIAFFSAPSRARSWIAEDHVVSPEKTHDLFERYRDSAFVLNPGSNYGKAFTPAEVELLLAGNFDGPPDETTSDQPAKVLLVHPREQPDALIAALAREFASVENVRGAFLMLAHRTDQSEKSWMLGIELVGDWGPVEAAINRAIAGGVLQGCPLEAVPLDDSELAAVLRTGTPVVAKKRGFFGLFR